MLAVVVALEEAEAVEEVAPVAEGMQDAVQTVVIITPTFLLPTAPTYPTWLSSSCKSS